MPISGGELKPQRTSAFIVGGSKEELDKPGEVRRWRWNLSPRLPQIARSSFSLSTAHLTSFRCARLLLSPKRSDPLDLSHLWGGLQAYLGRSRALNCRSKQLGSNQHSSLFSSVPGAERMKTGSLLKWLNVHFSTRNAVNRVELIQSTCLKGWITAQRQIWSRTSSS